MPFQSCRRERICDLSPEGIDVQRPANQFARLGSAAAAGVSETVVQWTLPLGPFETIASTHTGAHAVFRSGL
jgi:hypothetical protein